MPMHLPYALAAIVLIALSSPAFAQGGGSAGGTIPQQGGTISGTDETTSPAPRTSRDRLSRPGAKKRTAAVGSPSVRSVAGRWRWKATCSNGPGQGIFHLREKSRGEFEGEFGNTNYWDRGTILGGKVQGSRVTFVSHYATNRTWTATLSGSHMRGSFTGQGDCKFTATRAR